MTTVEMLALLRYLRITSGAEGFVIGGGAVRDHLLNRPIKDIDVWVPRFTDVHFDYLCRWHPDAYRLRGCNYWARDGLTGLINFKTTQWRGYPIQILEFNTGSTGNEWMKELIEGFDFGLSRALLTDNGLMVSSYFMQDRDQKVFRIRRCDGPRDYQRSLRRYERLKEKYPTFTLDTNGYEKYCGSDL